jgi:hypothetical protein
VNEMAAMLDINHGSAHHSSSAGWVAIEVTPELEERCFSACQAILQQCETEGDGFLKHIMAR